MRKSSPPQRVDDQALQWNDRAQADAILTLEHVSFVYPHRPGHDVGGEGGRARGRDGNSPAPAERDVPRNAAEPAPNGDGYAVRDVSLTVHAGEYVAILGRNGSGKSTLAKLMNGLLRPTEGRVLVGAWETTDRARLREIRRRVGMVFQTPDNQMVSTVVEEDVAFGLENYSVPYDEMRARVTDALSRVGMEAHRKRPPHQLSGGQKQRVAIASVIAMQPDCIVFDEATSMLDVEGRSDVTQLMRTLHADGIAIVAITHHMEEALQADRVVVMDAGRIVLEGTPREVFSNVETLRALGLDVPIAADMAVRLNRAFAQASVPFPVDVFTPAEFCEAWRTWRAALPAGTPFEAPASAAENGAANRPASAAENGAANRPASAPVNGAAEASAKPAGDAAGSVQASAADPVIDVRELAHVYLANTPLAHPALHDVTLEVGRGEIVAIVGQTGSGKSTLVQHFNALLTPQRGTVVVDGVDLTNPKADVKRVRRTVGLVFQSPEDQVFETLIGDDIAYGPFQFGLPLAEVRERVRQAMAWVGLDFAWRDRPVQALSGGQKRKVAIAGVLALRPQVMVLDEPTAGLDPQAREELLENLRRLRDESGMTLVIVTHQMEEVARLADRVIVMANGTVVLTCDTKTLFADARRLQALHLGLPESVALLRALAEQGEPVDPVQLTRDAAFAALCGLLGAGADGAHAPDPSSGIEVTTDGDS